MRLLWPTDSVMLDDASPVSMVLGQTGWCRREKIRMRRHLLWMGAQVPHYDIPKLVKDTSSHVYNTSQDRTADASVLDNSLIEVRIEV